jgi:DNA-binding SARP family transcriptional activator
VRRALDQTRNRIAVLGRLGVFPLERLSLAARRILAYLAIRGEPVARGAAASHLWPDLDEAGRANLRRSLWQLPRGWVSSVGDELVLHAQTDLAESRRVAARALSGDRLGYDELTLLSEDILPDWQEEWVLAAHDDHHTLRIQALESACRTLLAAGDFALATRAGSAALASEPLRESAAEALIDAHLAQCNRYEAVRCFRSLEKRLKDELGVTPHPALLRRIRNIANG